MDQITHILVQEVPYLRQIWIGLEAWTELVLLPAIASKGLPHLPTAFSAAFQSIPHLHHSVFIAIAIIPMLFFYFYGFLLFVVDMCSTNAFKATYKVQLQVEIQPSQYWIALKISLFNWFCLGFPYLAWLSYVIVPMLSGNQLAEIPTWWIFARDLTIYIVIEEIMFYFSHRLLHTSMFYSKIHKFHHTFTAPFGIAAIYAHPIEHMLSNVIPVSIGSLVMLSHPTLPMIWGVLALFNTMTVHSGYDFSCFLLFPAPYFHDWHHEKFHENFGAIQVLDYVLGTSKQYLQAIKRGEVYVPRKKIAGGKKE